MGTVVKKIINGSRDDENAIVARICKFSKELSFLNSFYNI